jgi:hypothetical protein
MPVSVIQAAKRALVTLLVTFARHYQVTLTISRESGDADVVKAFKKVVLKAHPDKGGRAGDASKLNDVRQVWETAKKNVHPPPSNSDNRGPAAHDMSISPPVQPLAQQGFRIQSLAVLLTYHGFTGVSHWRESERCQSRWEQKIQCKRGV